MKCLLFSVLVVLLVGIVMVPAVSSQQATIPAWIKNNAMWWASDQIPDSTFLQGIQFLIKEGIIVIPSTETSGSSQSQEVPTWVKNNAGWWAEDKISEIEFVNAIQYLIKHGIIVVNYGSSCANDLSEIFGDSNAIVQDICDLHESVEYSELVPAVDQINYNSLGFRGAEFSEIKPPNTYRIFLLGGSTMIGSGATSDETTKPGILQKIFDSDNSVQNIEVINGAFFGANAGNEFNLITQKLVHYQPDLIIIFDGLNDLKADYPIEYTKTYWKHTCEFVKKNNFDIIITLQPIPGFGNKKLTHQELVNTWNGQDHNGFQLISAKSTYDYMGRELLSLQNDCDYVVDLRGIFDDISGPIYWDQGHVSDTANLIAAEKFHEIINEVIFNKKSNDSKFHDVISKYNSPIIISYLLSKIGIDVDYTQIEKQELSSVNKRDGNYFYLKNQLGGSEKILVGKDLSKSDLSKINLTGQNLSGANLGCNDCINNGSGQDLRKIDLTGTILRGANLSFANLSGQDLSGKDLRGINFHNANLENADLSNITISKTVQIYEHFPGECTYPDDPYIDNVYRGRCVIKVLQNESVRTDFSDANLKGATITIVPHEACEDDSRFCGKFINFVDFSGADLTGIDFSDVMFSACSFNGATFHNNNINKAEFVLCDFSDATLINSKFFSSTFQDVSFVGETTKIIDGKFESVVFIDTDFSNADLEGTSFDEITVIGNVVFNCKNNQICN